MKVNTKTVTFEELHALPPPKSRKLKKPSLLFRILIRLLSIPDLVATKFRYTKERMDKAGKGPHLILMNHSSFIDLKIASKMLFPKPYFIITTADGFIGKEWLMRQIGCIPTQKFTADVTMARNILRAIRDKKTSVLLFPEAGYSFDGCATPLPRHLGALLKKLDVPVLSIITDGAFLRQPLYNDLRFRKVKTSAKMQCLLTREEIAEKSVDELDAIIDEAFSFDNFRNQYENNVLIKEPTRAQGLHRVLYRCPHCNAEGETLGEGVTLTCQKCGKVYTLTECGRMQAQNGETEYEHIPDWFNWQRACVRKELEDGAYALDLDVDIAAIRNFKAVYMIGRGKLRHDENGFVLDGCDGKLHFEQSPLASYSVNSDYNWYTLGDIICIGNKNCLYYCFPKQKGVVTKARFAAEELYKMKKSALAEK